MPRRARLAVAPIVGMGVLAVTLWDTASAGSHLYSTAQGWVVSVDDAAPPIAPGYSPPRPRKAKVSRIVPGGRNLGSRSLSLECDGGKLDVTVYAGTFLDDPPSPLFMRFDDAAWEPQPFSTGLVVTYWMHVSNPAALVQRLRGHRRVSFRYRERFSNDPVREVTVTFDLNGIEEALKVLQPDCLV